MATITRRAFGTTAAASIMCSAVPRQSWGAGGGETVSLDGFDQVFQSDFTPLGRYLETGAAAEASVGKSQWKPRYRFTAEPKGASFHGEYQWYVDPRYDWGPGVGKVSPFAVKDGTLSIVARKAPENLRALLPKRIDQEKKETAENYPWISGVITTENSFWFRYGYAEALMRLPKGQGLWPAFWMLPKEWPYPPEIDIMEFIGSEPRKSNYNVIPGAEDKPLPANGEFADRGLDLSDDWHTFGCLWTPAEFKFTLDGKVIGTVPSHPTLDAVHLYLILNLAVGGKWPGVPSAETPSPAAFQIKHLKVWQDKKHKGQ